MLGVRVRAVAYEDDIFLSYRRDPEARQWLVEHFQPLLNHYVEPELGREVTVFRDDLPALRRHDVARTD